jgi:uncharacterized protein (TIGR03000 family)
MYTVILATLLGGAAQQAEGWHWQRASCYGSCYGSCVGSCYGSSYGSCVGSCYGSCHGSCHGGGIFSHGCSGCTGHFGGGWVPGAFLAKLHAAHGCHGCTGSVGSAVVGYSNWASGCYGSSCYGGCYGAGGGGCYGYPSMPGSSSFVAPPMDQGGSNQTPPAPMPSAPMPPKTSDVPPSVNPPKAPEINIPPAPLPKGAELNLGTPGQARVIVHLPADAKLWVDQVACPLIGTTRSFDTPALASGAQYAYTLTVEMPDGRRENRRVTMAAGGAVEVEFRSPGFETVQK